MVKISGRLVEPADDKPRSGVTLTLHSVKNSSVVLKHATYRCVTGGNGEYSFNAAPGTYAVAVSVYGAEPERVGQIRVYSDSLPGNLNTFLMAPGESDLTPEIIRLVDSMRGEAVKAAESAKVSEQIVTQSASDVAEHAQQVASDKVVVAQKATIATDAAATAVAAKEQTAKDVAVTGQNRQVAETKAREAAASAGEANSARDSIVNDAADVRAKAKQVADDAVSVANNTAAVQRNTEQVAQNTLTVGTKAQQVAENTNSVSTNTLSVTQMRDEVTAKTAMAQGAADTATQKAASAATHDAAAAEYARQAQEAAQATAGALIDGGSVDLSGGVYPQPVMVGSTKRPTFWKVTSGGVVGGVDYGVGDTLIYTTSGGGSYYKIDNTESVTSVQGEKGAVTLTPEKIGAEAAGTASAGIKQHEAKSGAHNISGILGLDEALNGKVSKIIQLAAGADLNAVTDTGFYRLSSSAINAPVGVSVAYGLLQVIRGNDTITQIITGYKDGRRVSRSGDPADIGGTGKYTQWYEIYAQNSILGQVSQLAGVPTGAIIERGSNANGEYVKWADGTMICYWRTIFSTSCTSPYGAGLYTGSVTWTFPARFISSPITPPPGIRLSTGASWSVPFSATPTEANYYVVDAASRPVGTQAEFVGFAIGRWY